MDTTEGTKEVTNMEVATPDQRIDPSAIVDRLCRTFQCSAEELERKIQWELDAAYNMGFNDADDEDWWEDEDDFDEDFLD